MAVELTKVALWIETGRGLVPVGSENRAARTGGTVRAHISALPPAVAERLAARDMGGTVRLAVDEPPPSGAKMVARREGVAARDKLRDGVEAALLSLGIGFLSRSENSVQR